MVNWKVIKAHPDYMVSDQGEIWSERKDINLVQTPTKTGYLTVKLNGKTYNVHKLVAEAFIGPRPEGLQVRHLDGNPRNNNVTNLVYGTSKENHADMVTHGTRWQLNRTHCPKGHEYSGVNSQGARICQTCQNEAHRRWQAKQKGFR